MTLESVANVAGVSKATVHRVINDPGNVSVRTLETVRKAIAQTGYVPRGLRKKGISNQKHLPKTGNVGVLFYDTRKNSPLTSHLLHGMEVSSSSHQLNMMLMQFDGSGNLPASITQKNLDGLIVRPGTHGENIMSKLPDSLPSVWLFEKRRGFLPEGVDSIIPDDRAVGEIAFESLYQKDRRDILVVNTWPGHPAGEERILFMKNHATQFGVEVQVLCTEEISRHVIREQLSKMSGPKGIFFVGDTANLVQLYNLMHQLGMEIGHDYDMVTCSDDIEFLDKFDKRIAVINIQSEIVAQTAIETLMWRIENPTATGRKILIEPRLCGPGKDRAKSAGITGF